MGENKNEGWIDAVGVMVVGGLMLTITLVAAGGWSWFAKFLESAAPNWIQGVGTVAAILASGRWAQRQIKANETARAASEALAAKNEVERLRLRKRELLIGLLDIMTSARRLAKTIPITKEDSSLNSWISLLAEIERVRNALDRFQGKESLGIQLLRRANVTAFTLHQVHALAKRATVVEFPEPVSPALPKMILDRMNVDINDCIGHLSQCSTREEFAGDYREFEAVKAADLQTRAAHDH